MHFYFAVDLRKFWEMKKTSWQKQISSLTKILWKTLTKKSLNTRDEAISAQSVFFLFFFFNPNRFIFLYIFRINDFSPISKILSCPCVPVCVNACIRIVPVPVPHPPCIVCVCVSPQFVPVSRPCVCVCPFPPHLCVCLSPFFAHFSLPPINYFFMTQYPWVHPMVELVGVMVPKYRNRVVIFNKLLKKGLNSKIYRYITVVQSPVLQGLTHLVLLFWGLPIFFRLFSLLGSSSFLNSSSFWGYLYIWVCHLR